MSDEFGDLAEAVKELYEQKPERKWTDRIKCYLGLHRWIFSEDVDDKPIKICIHCEEVKNIKWRPCWEDLT